MLADQKVHLGNVRRLVADLDVFIFTMGLTECWFNKITNAVYPIAPGVTAGRFDEGVYGFRNLTYEQTKRDMLRAIELIRSINSDFRVLLTVSPVPLTATAENRHVLISTTHSKSVLRAVAGELAMEFDFVDYFPSYDIIVSPPFKGMFFHGNMRTIHGAGVDFVMTHFFAAHPPTGREKLPPVTPCTVDDDELCDEIFLELGRMSGK